MTNLFATVRNAALIALALGTIVAGAAPAQALSLKQLPTMGSDDHRDCDSRRDVKYYFQQYGLRHVDVQKTRDYDVYRVTGFAPPPREEAALSSSDDRLSSRKDYIRYVILFDACDHSKTRILQPVE